MSRSLVKIVHLSSAHPDRDVRIFLKECCSLARCFPDAEVHLVLAGVEERVESNVYIHSVQPRTGGRVHRMWTTVNQVYQKGLALDGTIYHLHDPELLRIARKLKRKGKHVVYDAHEDLPRQVLGKSYLPFRSIVSRVIEWYENRIAKQLDGIFTATPFIRDRFIKINPNTVDINNYPLLSEMEFEESTRERTTVCYIGGLTSIRGISQLVDAMQHTQTILQLAGNLDPIFKETLSKSEGWKNVVPRGHVSRSEGLEIKQSSFAGLVTFLPFPNHVNAQPNKIFEYMASGIPVIGSNFPLWKLLIEENNVGICVDPEDPLAIGKAIEYLRVNPEVSKAMGQRGRNLVQHTFNWSVEEQKLVSSYKNIMSS